MGFNPRVGGQAFEASAGGTDTTSSGSDVLMGSMTITPGAGDYLASFGSSVENSTVDTVFLSFYVNGVQVAESQRKTDTHAGAGIDAAEVVSLNKLLTGVLDGQAVEVRWRTTGGIATAHNRTLNLLCVAT